MRRGYTEDESLGRDEVLRGVNAAVDPAMVEVAGGGDWSNWILEYLALDHLGAWEGQG